MTVTINDPYAVGLKVHKTDDGSVVIVRGGHSPLILSVSTAAVDRDHWCSRRR